jgi:hypothetical protein
MGRSPVALRPAPRFLWAYVHSDWKPQEPGSACPFSQPKWKRHVSTIWKRPWKDQLFRVEKREVARAAKDQDAKAAKLERRA